MPSPSSDERRLLAFIAELELGEVAEPVRDRLSLQLADMAAVCAAGRAAPASRIALDYAAAVHPGDEANALLDSSRLGVAGAAFANGVLANVLDFDDGHRLTKGHPGAVIIPATLAMAQLTDASPEQLQAAVLVGYEVAVRAGIALHARDHDYHASGAWGAVGAAAAGARLLGLDAGHTLAAIGLAEYHAPIAPIMRCCAQPAMTKDACAWGALLGVQSALLAERGFTSVRAEFLDSPLDDLGTRWCVQELYIKAFPCCRWSQGAIAAALMARSDPRFDAQVVERIQIRTFGAADGLASLIPTDTEEAQYSLTWPVACALARGTFDVGDVLGGFNDPIVRRLFESIEVVVDPALSESFPGRRRTGLGVELSGGERIEVAPLEAPGEPEDPRLAEIVAGKVASQLAPEIGPEAGEREMQLSGLGADELLRLLGDRVPAAAHA